MNAREERLVTENNLWELDAWLDDVDVYAKPHFDYVNSQLVNTGIKFGNNPTRMTAFIGDTIVRHEDGSHTVLSAKDAAELARLRAERHTTNTALSEAAEHLRVQRDRIAELETASRQSSERWQARCDHIAKQGLRWKAEADGRKAHGEKLRARVAELEALTPAPIQTCQTCGAGYDLGEPCSVCAFHVLMELAEKKQRQAEDPHSSDLHHDYALGRDLPFVPRQVTGRCPKGHTFEDCTCGGGS